MTIPEGFREVRLGAERLADVVELDMWAFPTGDRIEDLLTVPSPLDWDRTVGIERVAEPGRLVALHASYAFGSTPVPGGRLPVAGLTWVGVHPQFRRRGLLTAMIDTHFGRCRERAEPVSLLFAAEPAIYGRFGYGTAARSLTLTLPRRAELRPVPGTDEIDVRIDTLDHDRHAELIGRLHAAVDRPGWITRATPELSAYWLSNADFLRNGREAQRIMIAGRGDVPVGYALFRRKGEWGQAGATGDVEVTELVAADPATAHALWSRLLDLDLTIEVRTPMLAPDDPLLSLLIDVRAGKGAWQDQLWARIIDLPAALAGRRYQADVDIVLNVADTRIAGNAGRWRLTAAAFGPSKVAPSGDPADLTLDVRELGAAYLGGTSLVEMAGAGLVTEHTPGALDRAAVAFGWPSAPVASWIF